MQSIKRAGFRARAVDFALQTVGTPAKADRSDFESQFDKVVAHLTPREITAEQPVVDVFLEVLQRDFYILVDHQAARYLDDVLVSEFVRVRKFMSEFYDA